MSRRAVAKPLDYNVDEASGDSDLNNTHADKACSTSRKVDVNTANGAKKRGRPKGVTATHEDGETKSKAKARRTQESKTKESKPPTSNDVRNMQAPGDVDERDEFDLDTPDNSRPMSTPMAATKQAKDVAVAAALKESDQNASKPRARKGRSTKKAVQQIPETQAEDREEEQAASSHFGRTPQAKKPPKPAKREIVQETQLESMDVDGEAPEERKELPARRKGGKNPGEKSTAQTTAKESADSPADQDARPTDTALRQRLADVTQKFENMEMRYQNLKNVGVDEAKINFDELKRRTDERSKASDALISKLRTELAAQSAQAAECVNLHSQISDLNTSTEKLKTDNKTLETSLSSAQAEIRALQAKLQASRSNSEQRSTVPSSAAKSGASSRALPPVAEDTQKRALKEDLYGDLTGLIIRDVKRRDEDNMDVYDCIQTGKNGTLHFHLALPNPPPAGTAYGDAEFEYTPLLNASHDRSLIDVLPDYLTEEIIFPQREAPRFYSRINEFIMKTRPVASVDEVGGVENNTTGDMDGDF